MKRRMVLDSKIIVFSYMHDDVVTDIFPSSQVVRVQSGAIDSEAKDLLFVEHDSQGDDRAERRGTLYELNQVKEKWEDPEHVDRYGRGEPTNAGWKVYKLWEPSELPLIDSDLLLEANESHLLSRWLITAREAIISGGVLLTIAPQQAVCSPG